MTARTDLEKLSRDDLIARARRLGVNRPEVMTRVELGDEIVRREEPDPNARRRARGWLGVARDLVASLIEEGLNMPDAAALVRQTGLAPTRVVHQSPVATVTLAEIYSTQGHSARAIKMLDEVLEKEPDHAAARALRDRLTRDAPKSTPPPAPSEVSADSEAPESEPMSDRSPLSEPTLASAVEDFVPEPVVIAPRPEPEPEPEPTREIAFEAVLGPVTPALAPALDAVIAVRGGDDSLYLYWEISENSESRARTRAPSGRAAVKIVAYRPGISIADRIEREIDVELPSGSAIVPGLGVRSVVRVAIGWKTSDAFRPLAVGTEIEKRDGDATRVRYTPIGARRSGALEAAERRALENLSRAHS